VKIFGLEISLSKNKDVEDAVPVSAVKPGGHVPISRIPSVRVAPLVYAQQFARVNRGVFFLAPEYDLAEIGKIEDTESLVRQAFKKKEGLMFKEGVSYRGKNKTTIQYIKTRMAQIAQASGIPTISLMKRVARSLIRCSNAYLVKVRSTKASGGGIRTTAEGKNLQPIAAYFPAAPEMFKMDLDPETGKIRHWRQQLPNGWYKLFKPEDVIHFTLDKREGFSYGVPSLVPVVDDIRALRQIEENIELLIYQHLFPLFHYKVGTETKPALYTEDGKREVDLVRDEIRLMPAEGMLVTDERAEISAIGAEGRAMNAEAYLNYFKKRVYMGLGMSSVDFGEADTSNRATANVVSRALVDAVKSIQDEFEAIWDQHVIRELLLESTFGEDVLEEEHMVHLRFSEIDLQNKIEHEKHAAEMFKGHGLTWDEFRNELGQEPIIVPEDPDDQANFEQYPEWFNTYWKLFFEPEKLISAVDEPYSQAAQAAVQARSSAFTSEGQATAQKGAMEMQKAAHPAPTARPSKAPRAKDSYIGEAFEELEKDTSGRLLSSVKSRGRIDKEYLTTMARNWSKDTADKVTSRAAAKLIQGFADQTGGYSVGSDEFIAHGRKKIADRIQKTLDRLARDVVGLIAHRVGKKLENKSPAEEIDNAIDELHVAFDAVRYRADFMSDVEIRKAYNYGRLLGLQHIGAYGYQLVAHTDGCDRCKALNGRIYLSDDADIDDVPPFHPNSRMEIKILFHGPAQLGHDELHDWHTADDSPKSVPIEMGKAVSQESEAAEKQSAVCPKCGFTALLQSRSGNYYCSKCRLAFRKVEDDLNVGGAGTVPTRQPSKPQLEKAHRDLAPIKRPCPRCGLSVESTNGKYKCTRCNYSFKEGENPRKVASGKPISPMPPKKRKEEAELPASTGGPGSGGDATHQNDDILEDRSIIDARQVD
jgi:SPP1 gp7 family putative phage head morphogenesis protein